MLFPLRKLFSERQISFSNNFDRVGSSDIGRKHSFSFLHPFLLKIGETLAIFHLLRKYFLVKHKFRTLVREGTIAGAAILRIFIPIPSSPLALWEGIDISNSNTSVSVTGEISKLIIGKSQIRHSSFLGIHQARRDH